MAGRKVLVQDDGTGHQGYVEEGPSVLLTGDATTTGHHFRGPDDPADTPAFLALLESGDEWTDTTGGAPYQHKVRNGTNDGWDWAIMVVKDALGAEISSVDVSPANGGTALLAAGPGGDPAATVIVQADGHVFIRTGTTVIDASPAIVTITTDDGLAGSFGADGLISLQNAAFAKVELTSTGDVKLAGPNIEFLPDVSIKVNGELMGWQAAAVPDCATADPADLQTTLNALLQSLRNSSELAT